MCAVIATMWHTTVSACDFTADIGTVTGDVWAVTASMLWAVLALSGMLQPLCDLLLALWGLLWAKEGHHRRYVGCYYLYVAYCSLHAGY